MTTMTNIHNIPVKEEDFYMPDYTLPMFETENGEWYGYGHLDKSEFMSNIRVAFGAVNPEDPSFKAEDVQHTYGVVYLPEKHAHLYNHFNPADVDREFCAVRRAARDEDQAFPLTVWVP